MIETNIFMSPEPVSILLSSRNLQELRNPSYPASSLTTFAAPVASRLLTSYTVHILSIPPQAAHQKNIQLNNNVKLLRIVM